MAITQANKGPGDLLRSSDWNELLAEAKRLDSAKFDKSGGNLSGNLSVSGALAVGTNQFSGSLNVSSNNQFQARLQQTKNDEWARLALNANGNEWHLAVGAPGIGVMAGNLNFYSPAVGDVLSLQPTGRVGVGVNQPTTTLHVRGGNWDLTNTDGDLKIGNDTYRLKIGIALGGGGAGDTRIRAMGGSNRLVLGSGSTDMLILQEGAGLAIPNVTLNFGAQVRQMINLWHEVYGIGIQSWTQYYRTDRNFAWFIGGTHNDNLLDPGGGTAAMALVNGSLGIGTTAPAQKVHVIGPRLRLEWEGRRLDLRADGSAVDVFSETSDLVLNNNERLTIARHLRYYQTFSQVSARELKDHIAPISLDEATAIVMSLKPVSFQYKDDIHQETQLGFVADEVPPAVATRDGAAVKPTHIVTALTRLVQEQQEALRELKAEIDRLKQQPHTT
ncbi:MAG TPA: tail fiber domain-containing protein [Herpetosiphonaceae bacterium]